jgi:hypothetical protein
LKVIEFTGEPGWARSNDPLIESLSLRISGRFLLQFHVGIGAQGTDMASFVVWVTVSVAVSVIFAFRGRQ